MTKVIGHAENSICFVDATAIGTAWYCEECGEAFLDHKKYSKHKKYDHTDRDANKDKKNQVEDWEVDLKECNYCSYSTPLHDELKFHISSHHLVGNKRDRTTDVRTKSNQVNEKALSTAKRQQF